MEEEQQLSANRNACHQFVAEYILTQMAKDYTRQLPAS